MYNWITIQNITKFLILGFINEVQALHQPAADPKCQVIMTQSVVIRLVR